MSRTSKPVIRELIECVYTIASINTTQPSPVGQSVSLVLGTAALGGLYRHVDDGDAVALVEHAGACGITHFDTAPQYGHGTSEERLGQALRTLRSETITVSTKVGRIVEPADTVNSAWFVDAPPSTLRVDYSAAGVHQSLADSCRRLQRERVETVFIHDPDDHLEWAMGEAAPALRALQSEGVITSIGIGVNSAAVAERFVMAGLVDEVLIAGRHSLLDTSAAATLLPACAQRNVRVTVGGVFNSGLLAKRPDHLSTYNYLPVDEVTFRQAAALFDACDRRQLEIGHVSLHAAAAHSAVARLAIGPRSVTELEQMLNWWQTPIDADVIESIRSEARRHVELAS
jgi:D-threo-aldose 1-dehydrogenase